MDTHVFTYLLVSHNTHTYIMQVNADYMVTTQPDLCIVENWTQQKSLFLGLQQHGVDLVLQNAGGVRGGVKQRVQRVRSHRGSFASKKGAKKELNSWM